MVQLVSSMADTNAQAKRSRPNATRSENLHTVIWLLNYVIVIIGRGHGPTLAPFVSLLGNATLSFSDQVSALSGERLLVRFSDCLSPATTHLRFKEGQRRL